MKNGVTFSLPHRLEIEVADLLVQKIPCAQKVRFFCEKMEQTPLLLLSEWHAHLLGAIVLLYVDTMDGKIGEHRKHIP